ncbi:acetyl-CoA carboxylase biotin carboxyl carrier protein [Caldifermentibacillus hisashii]|uniref:acetyl-CoA carboxylase biotin carboxyl carrier protein n=1 Tax=Caldifermentibacillus hisashii TaxID=996558 RepID=UPI0031B6D36B
MLKVQEIRELIRLVDQSNIDEFKYEYDGLKIVMKKNQPVQVKTVEPIKVEPVNTFIDQPTNQSQVAQPVQEVKVESAKANPAVQLEKTNVPEENLHEITSPMVGTFYASPSPDAEPYVKVGSKVKSDSVVCIVEAMKLFNEIEADVDGEIVEILVKNGQLVEFGQPLFLVKVD